MRRSAASLLAPFAAAAVSLVCGSARSAADTLPLGLSLAPWTGPELPNSVAGTIKYRLVVNAAPGASVTLRESGLPAHWIGSFCSDRVCAPFRTHITVAADGMSVVEFQVIPTTRATGAFTFRIAARSGASTASTGATVAGR